MEKEKKELELMLLATMKENQGIVIEGKKEGKIILQIVKIRSDLVRIGIEAPLGINVCRREVWEMLNFGGDPELKEGEIVGERKFITIGRKEKEGVVIEDENNSIVITVNEIEGSSYLLPRVFLEIEVPPSMRVCKKELWELASQRDQRKEIKKGEKETKEKPENDWGFVYVI